MTSIDRRALLRGTAVLGAGTALALTGCGSETQARSPRMVIVYFSRPGENYWYSDRRDLDVGNTQVVGILATVIAVTIAVEMLPNLLGLIAASIVGTMTAAVIGLTTLSFIGVIPVTNYNWGTILNWASAQGAFH